MQLLQRVLIFILVFVIAAQITTIDWRWQEDAFRFQMAKRFIFLDFPTSLLSVNELQWLWLNLQWKIPLHLSRMCWFVYRINVCYPWIYWCISHTLCQVMFCCWYIGCVHGGWRTSPTVSIFAFCDIPFRRCSLSMLSLMLSQRKEEGSVSVCAAAWESKY